LIVAIEIAVAEFSTSSSTISKVPLAAAHCIVQPISQVAWIELLTFTPEGLVALAQTTVDAIQGAGAIIARLNSAAIFPHLQEIPHLIVGGTIRLVSV
jgi:hypothetical protein